VTSTDVVERMRGQIEQADDRPRTLSDQLEALVPQVAKATGRTDLAERVVRMGLTEVRKSPELAQCTAPSIMGAVMQSAQLRLDPGQPLGHSWMIPMKHKGIWECEWWLGYKGIIELAHRSGQLTGITADVVREADRFEAVRGTTGRLVHEIDWRASQEDRGPVYAAYAHAKLLNGGDAWEVLTLEQINERRAMSRGSDSKFSPWVNWFDRMAAKSAVHALGRWLPACPDYGDGVAADGRVMEWDPARPEVPAQPAGLDAAELLAAMPESESESEVAPD
jgi:recombination protein RecT